MEKRDIATRVNKAEKANLGFIACTDTNAHSVQSNVSIELPHMVRPHPQPTRVVSVSLLPTACIGPLYLTCVQYYS